MLASLLYHTNQITDIQVKNVEYLQDKIIFHVTYKPKKILCPCCEHAEYSLKGNKTRKIRMAPLGDKSSFLQVKLSRLKCLNCSQIWWPRMPFVRGNKRVTRSFEKYVIDMMRFATVEHVARFLEVAWEQSKIFTKHTYKKNTKVPILSCFNM